MQIGPFVLEGLCAHLANRGHSEALRSEAGVSEEQRRAGRARMDIDSMLCAGKMAYRLSGDPALALHAAESAPLSSLGLLGCLVLQCATLREALGEAERYLPLLTDGGRLRARDDGTTTKVWLDLPLRTADAQRFAVEYGFTLLARIAREYLVQENGLVELRFPFAEPSYVGEYRRLFGCQLRFDQLRSELVFSSERLDRQRGFHDERLLRLLKEEADSALECETLGVPVHRRVYNLLRSDPALWDAGPNKLGKLLGMSSRRLRRRLISEGKSLSGLIEDARLDRARYLLLETDVAIKSIAERLGYSEPSAFHRAFKRWTGQTPGRYKRDQRAISLAS